MNISIETEKISWMKYFIGTEYFHQFILPAHTLKLLCTLASFLNCCDDIIYMGRKVAHVKTKFQVGEYMQIWTDSICNKQTH